jgi:hypothetical protein
LRLRAPSAYTWTRRRWWISLLLSVATAGCINVNVAVPPNDEEVETDVQRVRRAVAEMRNVAVTLEVALVDGSGFPRAEDGSVHAGRIALSPLPRIADELPQGSRIPALDPWGYPYLYWSSGTQYVILSTGSDGRLDEPSAVETFLGAAGGRVAAAPVHTSCVEDDIVLVNAQLVQYPNRTIRRCR